MKKLLMLITLLILPIMVSAETFKYEDSVYAVEELNTECVPKQYIPIFFNKNNELVFVHASGDTQFIKLDNSGKCSEITKEDYLNLFSSKYYNYELEKNDQGKYIIKKDRGDRFAYFVKTKDTEIVEGKEYIVVTEDVRYIESEPVKEELNNYYENILLTKPDKLEINPDITYYKESINVDVYEVVENPNIEEILEYYVEDSYTAEIFDIVNIENIEEIKEKAYFEIVTNSKEDVFYFYIADDNNQNGRVLDNNGKEIEKFKNSQGLFFLSNNLLVVRYNDKTEIYDDKLNLIHTIENYIHVLEIGYGEYTNYLYTIDLKNNKFSIYLMNEHKLLEGNNQTYNDEDLTFKFSGKLDNLSKVEINGKELDSKNYNTKSGSTIITLNNDYLKTLSSGEYDLKLTYKDEGYSNVTFKVETEALEVLTKNPETSDNILGQLSLLFVSVCGLSVSLNLRKNKNRN